MLKIIMEKALIPVVTLGVGVLTTWWAHKEEREHLNILNTSKKLETILEEHFSARGKGLHEKVTSIEDKLEKSDINGLRLIASVRNKKMHDDNAKIDMGKFEKTYVRIEKRFKEIYNIDL